MKRRKLMAVVLVASVALALGACGSAEQGSNADATGSASEEIVTDSSAAAESGADAAAAESGADAAAAEEASADAAEGAQGEAEINPYAWLGFEAMPKCNYLDVLTSNHYYQVADMYLMGHVSEQIDAVDGINSYKENTYSKVWTVDGRVISLNEDAKQYMESDMSGLIDMAKESQEKSMSTGTNETGRTYVGTGKEAIPEYADQTGDTAEYDYYEFNYPEAAESTGFEMTEKYYMKGGDVFAICTILKSESGETPTTQVIKTMSTDIPEGTLEIPDLSGYEKYE